MKSTVGLYTMACGRRRGEVGQQGPMEGRRSKAGLQAGKVRLSWVTKVYIPLYYIHATQHQSSNSLGTSLSWTTTFQTR